MVQDPKQIVTPFAFDVHADLLGLPLATPKRRFAALMLDLVFASILSSLGAWILAASATALFFWLAIRNKGNSLFKYSLRFAGATFATIFVFAVTFHFTKSEKTFNTGDSSSVPLMVSVDSSKVVTGGSGNVDWSDFTKKAMTIDYSDSETAENEWEKLGRELERNMGVAANEDEIAFYDELYSDLFRDNLNSFSNAIEVKDSLAIDSLRTTLVPVIAAAELGSRNQEIERYKSRADDLSDRVEDLREMVDNPSFFRSVKALAADFGLNIGWIGIYFILCLPLFRGKTLGKKMLKLQVVRLNNEPIGLWYSFERFGGYAAGLATGLLGFLQVYWDPNRQAIHDKIAATVVVDLREKKRIKTDTLRKKVLGVEELIVES